MVDQSKRLCGMNDELIKGGGPMEKKEKLNTGGGLKGGTMLSADPL